MLAILASLRSSMRTASSTYARPTRLTMKPGASEQYTDVLPSASTNSSATSEVSVFVRGVPTTSTRAIKGTGLKKCRPMTRSGRRVAAAQAATESELVLVARTTSAAATASRPAKTRSLTASSSTAASMTTSASRAVATRSSTSTRLAIAASRASAVMRALATQRSRPSRTRSRAVSAAAGTSSKRRTRMPAARQTCAMPLPIVPAPTMPTFMTIASDPSRQVCASRGMRPYPRSDPRYRRAR